MTWSRAFIVALASVVAVSVAGAAWAAEPEPQPPGAGEQPAGREAPSEDEPAVEPSDGGPSEADRWFRERAALSLGGRSVIAVGRRAGMRLQLYGAGASLQLTSALQARGLLMGLRTAGRHDEGEAAPFGLGGELGLYLSPWPDALVRPHAFGGAGLFVFPSAPFLPGGSHYDFMLSAGLGMEVSASDQLVLGLDAFATHLSNGQGIGDHNPALDGYGASLRLSYALSPRTVLPSEWRDEEPEPARGYVPAVMVDGSVGYIDDAVIGGARGRVAQRLVGGLLAVLDGEAGRFAGAPYGEIGLGLVTHFEAVSLAAHGGYRRYVGTDTALVAVQIEAHVSDEVSLLGVGHHEAGGLGGEIWRGVLGFRSYPIPSLLVEAGIGFVRDPLGPTPDATNVVGVVGVEYVPPLPLGPWQLAVFAESQASGLRIAGVRVAYGAGSTPRSLARTHAFRRMR